MIFRQFPRQLRERQGLYAAAIDLDPISQAGAADLLLYPTCLNDLAQRMVKPKLILTESFLIRFLRQRLFSIKRACGNVKSNPQFSVKFHGLWKTWMLKKIPCLEKWWNLIWNMLCLQTFANILYFACFPPALLFAKWKAVKEEAVKEIFSFFD